MVGVDPGDPRYSVAVWLWWTVGILTLLEAQRGDTADGGVPPLHEAVKIEQKLLFLGTDLTVVKLQTIAEGRLPLPNL